MIEQKAKINDAGDIQKIINQFAKEGLMLPRSLNLIYESIRDFWIIKEDKEIAACCALHILWEDMAEIKSLAVKKKYQGKGFGQKLVKAGIEEAKRLDVKKIFALTYVPEFFKSFGFKEANKENMPHKIWSECINCPHFPDCDEILVVKEL